MPSVDKPEQVTEPDTEVALKPVTEPQATAPLRFELVERNTSTEATPAPSVAE